MRIRASPAGELTVEQQAEVPDPPPVVLEPRALAGGLGAHKWLDLLGEPHWLVVDHDGQVLETATANAWALLDGVLMTPPADGRLLAGVTRRLLALPGTREALLTLNDLARARAILLTSSIRLVTPAGLQAEPSSTAVQLAAELRGHPAISRKTGSYIRLKRLEPVVARDPAAVRSPGKRRQHGRHTELQDEIAEAAAMEGRQPGVPGGPATCLTASSPPPSASAASARRRRCRRSCSPTPTSPTATWPATR